MITKIFEYIRAGLIMGLMMGVVLLAVEVYFVVTNSNRPDFWPDDTDAPPPRDDKWTVQWLYT